MEKRNFYRNPISQTVCLITLCLAVLLYLQIFSKALVLVNVVVVVKPNAIQFPFAVPETTTMTPTVAPNIDGKNRSSSSSGSGSTRTTTGSRNGTRPSAVTLQEGPVRPSGNFSLETILEDMGSMISCGVFKCFFPSKSDVSMGWLVMPARRYYRSTRTPVSTHAMAHRAWGFATTTTYHHRSAAAAASSPPPPTDGGGRGRFRHYYPPASPPFTTGRLSSDVSTNVWKPKFDRTLCPLSDCRLTVKSKEGFTVQHLQRAPASAILVKLHVDDDDPSGYTWRTTPSWEDFWEKVHTRSESNHTDFVQHFVDDLDVALQLIQEIPTFKVDFQCIITTDGYVYHLDLDRLYEAELLDAGWRHKWDPHVLPALEELRRIIVDAKLSPWGPPRGRVLSLCGLSHDRKATLALQCFFGMRLYYGDMFVKDSEEYFCNQHLK